jgi:hypothetical protein
VLALQLGRPDLGVVLGEPAGEAAHRVLVRRDGVGGVAVCPQRQLPRDGEHVEVWMRHPRYYLD